MSYDEIEWLKLPVDLQAKFYKKAEEDAESLIDKIQEIEKVIRRVEMKIKDMISEIQKAEKSYLIAAVDGCKSFSFSERLGFRFSLLSASYVLMKDTVEERSPIVASLKEKISSSKELAKFRASLILTSIERKLALEALQKADYVFIDGSFYGFIYPLLSLKKTGILDEKLEELIKDVFDLTNELIKTKRAIAVIKRTRTSAIAAWMYLKEKDNSAVGLIDRLILHKILRQGSYLDYRKLIGEENVQVFNQVSLLLSKRKSDVNIDEAREKALEPFNSLNLSPEYFQSLRRLQVKGPNCDGVCELEHPSLKEEEIAELLSQRNLFNENTGLPLALDIADSLISFSNKFTEEYVTEVEARVLEKALEKRIDSEMIRSIFFHINPQKK